MSGITYYQEPSTYIVPPYRLASMVPWRNRTAAICLYVVQAAEHMVIPDQSTRVNGSQILGLIFCKTSE